eukprot:13709855-Alexandrium_andersonii.AAC.1
MPCSLASQKTHASAPPQDTPRNAKHHRPAQACVASGQEAPGAPPGPSSLGSNPGAPDRPSLKGGMGSEALQHTQRVVKPLMHTQISDPD